MMREANVALMEESILSNPNAHFDDENEVFSTLIRIKLSML